MALALAAVLQSSAMGYSQAREQALFLTDKMAYELNLTEDQYEAAYEINLDYLMGIGTYDDLYGNLWVRRNTDLRYILLDWQYRAYVAASYFYRPLYWNSGVWHFGIYARYPHRTHLYFGRPRFYSSYRGAHSWHRNGGRSWYSGRKFGLARGGNRLGMRDGLDRGRHGRTAGPATARDRGAVRFGSGHSVARQSSTRATAAAPQRPAAGQTRKAGDHNRFGGSRNTSPGTMAGAAAKHSSGPSSFGVRPSAGRSSSAPAARSNGGARFGGQRSATHGTRAGSPKHSQGKSGGNGGGHFGGRR